MQTQADPLNYHFGLDTDNTTSNLSTPPPTITPAATASSTLLSDPVALASLESPPLQSSFLPPTPEAPAFFLEPLSKRPTLKIPEPFVPAKKPSALPLEDQIAIKAFSKCSANGLTYNLGDKPPAIPGVSVSQEMAVLPLPTVMAKLTADRKAYNRKRNVDEKFNAAGIFTTFKIAGSLLAATLVIFCSFQAFDHFLRNSPTYMKEAGDVAVYCGAQSIAMKIFDHNLRQPQNVDILVDWGTTSRAQGRLDDALAFFDKAISLRSDYSAAYLNRAATYLDLKQPQKALADANRAIAHDSANAMAYNNRGCIYVAGGKFALASVDFSKAITLEPNTVLFWLNRGNCCMHLKQYKQAIQNYDIAIAHGNVPAKEMKLQAQKLMAPTHTVHSKKHQSQKISVNH